MTIHLLIVDKDDEFRRHLISRMIRRIGGGHGIRVAEHLPDVERIMAGHAMDLAILNLESLGQEGLGILERIKIRSPSTQVILLNNPGQIALSIAAMKLGALDEFSLPLDVESLITRIVEAWERNRPSEPKENAGHLSETTEDSARGTRGRIIVKPDHSRKDNEP